MTIAYAAILVLTALLAWREYQHDRERSELLNRLMAKNLGEFQYYKDKWPADIKAVKAAQAIDIKAQEAAVKTAAPKSALADFEEFGAEEEDEG